jgi:uncharacterized integral membrane protein
MTADEFDDLVGRESTPSDHRRRPVVVEATVMSGHDSDRDTIEEIHVVDDRPGDVGRALRWFFAAVVAAIVIAVGVDNRDKVRVGYVIGDAETPMWLVLIGAAIAGVIIGWLIKHRPRHDR